MKNLQGREEAPRACFLFSIEDSVTEAVHLLNSTPYYSATFLRKLAVDFLERCDLEISCEAPSIRFSPRPVEEEYREVFESHLSI